MTYKLNGINYTEMLLTDEELAVVKVMREEEPSINVFVKRENKTEAEKYVFNFPNRNVFYDMQNDAEKFVYVSTGKTNVFADYEKN